MKFNFNEEELKILANFSSINQQMLVEPDKFSVMSVSKAVLANYPFTTPYTFSSFGLYNTSDFLSLMSVMKKAQIEVKPKCLSITSDQDRLTYYTTAAELVPKVPDTDKVFASLDYDLEFSLPADRLSIIMKVIPQLKAKFMFFETVELNNTTMVRITIGDELETSATNYELFIKDDVKINKLSEAVCISLEDLKLLQGEYQIGIARKEVKGKTKYFSKWANLNGVTYYVATEAVA